MEKHRGLMTMNRMTANKLSRNYADSIDKEKKRSKIGFIKIKGKEQPR